MHSALSDFAAQHTLFLFKLLLSVGRSDDLLEWLQVSVECLVLVLGSHDWKEDLEWFLADNEVILDRACKKSVCRLPLVFLESLSGFLPSLLFRRMVVVQVLGYWNMNLRRLERCLELRLASCSCRFLIFLEMSFNPVPVFLGSCVKDREAMFVLDVIWGVLEVKVLLHECEGVVVLELVVDWLFEFVRRLLLLLLSQGVLLLVKVGDSLDGDHATGFPKFA